MADLDESILELGTKPISDGAATGNSVRYEPEFEQLEAEVSKLEALNATAVNWRAVVEAGVLILREKSKDILVASYLCRGLLEQNGYAGLAAGLTVLRDMATQYWDDLFPELRRLRARAGAVSWMAEKVAQVVAERKPAAGEADAVKICLERIGELETLLDEKLADQSPAFGDLRRALREYDDEFSRQEQEQEQEKAQEQAAQKATEAAPARAGGPSETAAASGAPAPAPAGPAPAASAPEQLASDSDVQKAIRSCQNVMRRIAEFRRGRSLGDAMAYRLLRSAVWMGVEAPPPNQDGVTAVPPVDPERLKFFDAQVQSGSHAALVPEVETTFALSPFWLAAHRLVASALEALGNADARNAVVNALAALLTRAPWVIDLKFADGTPFADDMTRLWIQNEVTAGGGGEAVTPTVGAGGGDAAAPWADAAREAQKLAAKGRFAEAALLFRDGVRQAASQRERFLWELQQARFCQEAGHVEVAIPQLEYLDDQAERYRLEEWEPDLSLEIARLLTVCYTHQNPKDSPQPERIARTERLAARLCRLDVGTAVKLLKG